MIKYAFRNMLAVATLAVTTMLLGFTGTYLEAKEVKEHKFQHFKHDITLQLTDSLGFPFPEALFTVTLDIIKEGPKVTIQFPVINFQTLSIAAPQPAPPFIPPGNPFGGTPIPGGYINTFDGFLPKCVRPTDLVNLAFIVPTFSGATESISLLDVPPANPISGYILQVTNSGAIVIQAAGTYGNIIPPGNQVLMPTSITYIIQPKHRLCENIVLSRGATNTTGFTDPGLANSALRDSHVGDAYNNTIAWAWTDNSNIDQTQNTLNVMVAVGSVDSHGKLQANDPVQLTDLPANTIAWDTAVSIVRAGPHQGNIVVSWGQFPINNANLTITSPGAIIGTYNATVGALSPIPFSLVGKNIKPAPFPGDACAPIPANYFGPNDIALIAANGFACGSNHKATNAFNAGAVGVIIYNDTNELIAINGSPLVPTILVGNYVGNLILNNLPVTGSISATNNNNAVPYRAVSMDGGVTWPINGPLDILPIDAGGFGDNRGVLADKFGNVWYSTTIFNIAGNTVNQPMLAFSTDGGVTFTPYPEANLNIPAVTPGVNNFDYPQICLGTDQDLNYGLYMTSLYSESNFPFNVYPTVWFLPISNPIDTSQTAEVAQLTQFQNNAAGNSITASMDGRVWLQGIVSPFLSQSFINSSSILFKSPGAIDENYAGPWIHDIFRNFIPYTGHGYPASGYSSQPEVGVLLHSVNSIVYDDARQAFYACLAFQTPDYSQDMRYVLVISRDYGQTWCNPIDIATSHVGNRGLQSMALDTVTGNLLFGWYDGRNDPVNKQSLEYFAAVIPAKKLDKVVNSIPLSKPFYEIPATSELKTIKH